MRHYFRSTFFPVLFRRHSDVFSGGEATCETKSTYVGPRPKTDRIIIHSLLIEVTRSCRVQTQIMLVYLWYTYRNSIHHNNQNDTSSQQPQDVLNNESTTLHNLSMIMTMTGKNYAANMKN